MLGAGASRAAITRRMSASSLLSSPVWGRLRARRAKRSAAAAASDLNPFFDTPRVVIAPYLLTSVNVNVVKAAPAGECRILVAVVGVIPRSAITIVIIIIMPTIVAIAQPT